MFWEGKEMHPVFVAKFGEMCVVTYCNNTQEKLANFSRAGILVGFADADPVVTIQVLNPKKRQINLMQVMTFLNHWDNIDVVIFPVSYQGFDENNDNESIFGNNDNIDNKLVFL